MRKKNVSVVITDIDNTLFDWGEIWYHSFSVMLDRVAANSKVPRDRLIKEIRAIHQKHGTSEYAFLIEELPSLQERHQGENLVEVYDDAIHAYRSARKKHLKLYPGVMETLTALKENRNRIVAYTESLAFYTD